MGRIAVVQGVSIEWSLGAHMEVCGRDAPKRAPYGVFVRQRKPRHSGGCCLSGDGWRGLRRRPKFKKRTWGTRRPKTPVQKSDLRTRTRRRGDEAKMRCATVREGLMIVVARGGAENLYLSAGISHFRTMCQLKTMLSGGIC
jgi:hypothetical protein